MTKSFFAALAAVLCVFSAWAAGPSPSQAKVSEADARQTALQKVPGGTIQSAELEKERGRLIWSFEVASPGSRDITEVNVDAETGKIVAVHSETPAAEKKEAAAEKKESRRKHQ